MARTSTDQREAIRALQAHAAVHAAMLARGIRPHQGNCPFPEAPTGKVLKGQASRLRLKAYRDTLNAVMDTADLVCPICGTRAPARSKLWEWDHNPQQAGQSSLGEWAMASWICKGCNKSAGHGFESRAKELDVGTLTRLGLLALPPDGFGGKVVVPRSADQMLTDVKAAFGVAFIVLGHRWARSPAVEPVRRAIEEADLSLMAGHGYISLRSDGLHGRGVSESPGALGFVAVHSGDGTAVVLPGRLNSRPPILDSSESYRVRTFPWPVFRQRGLRAVHASCDDGLLFHLDMCDREAPPTTGLSGPALAA